MAMEWLRVLALGGLLLISPGAVWGQQRAANSAGAGSFTVVGDVDKPGNYRFEDALTVRSAVAVASPVSDAVNVTVLRNGHERAQSTRLLRLSSVDSGELAMSGDIYVVESLAVMTRPVLPNAVVRSGATTTVVSLEDAGVVIGDVLRGLGIPCDGETRVALPCRIHGMRSAESVAVSASVRHGDVISVGGTAVAAVYGGADGRTEMRPVVSEWSSPVRRPAGAAGGTGAGSGSATGRPEARLPELPAVSAVPADRGDLRAAGAPAGVVVGGGSSAAGVVEQRLPAVPVLPAAPTLPLVVDERGSESGVSNIPKPSVSVREKSDGRVVIVGEGQRTFDSQGSRQEVLLLGDSLRVGAGTEVEEPRRDGVAADVKVRTGRSVSGSGKPPISAAVSTRTETELAESPGVDSSRGVHWAVIVGLFIAGVWVLGRSLLVGSMTAAGERAAVVAVSGERERSVAAAVVQPSIPVAATSSMAVSRGAELPPSDAVAISAGVELAGEVPEPGRVESPWRIYSVPRGLRRSGEGVGGDDLDLLIENRMPVDRGEARVPESLELTGRPGGLRGGMKIRVDSAHMTGAEGHLSGGELRLRRGRSLEDRLSQLIRAVPTGLEGNKSGKSGGASAGAAGVDR